MEKLTHVNDDPLADLSWLLDIKPYDVMDLVSKIYPKEWRENGGISFMTLGSMLSTLAYETNRAPVKFEYVQNDSGYLVRMTVGNLPPLTAFLHDFCVYYAFILIHYLKLHYPEKL